jgi:hypothetical protein
MHCDYCVKLAIIAINKQCAVAKLFLFYDVGAKRWGFYAISKHFRADVKMYFVP